MTELSPAAQAVLQAATRQACLSEWGAVNDPPCHPDDEGWKGCHLCVKCDLIAAALRAAVDYTKDCPVRDVWQCDADEILAIAAELEGSHGQA